MHYYKPEPAKIDEHYTVYYNENEFCSWPSNAGMWNLGGGEVLVGFMNVACDYDNPRSLNHNRVETFSRILTCRTRDGGKTWSAPAELADNVKLSDELIYGVPQNYNTPYDFSSPRTLLACWSTPNSGVDNAKAWYKLSADGGESWGPAVLLDASGIPRVQGRPAYLLRPDGVILLYVTGRPAGEKFDRPLVFISTDGGQNFNLSAYMPGNPLCRVICPTPVFLPDGRILAAVRCKPSLQGAWSELYASDDGGLSFTFLSRICDHGDNQHLVLLRDGRLFCVYGFRRPPFGLRARISEDGGYSWGPELIIRDDGGGMDLGYPRAVELPDGKILMAYYHFLPDAAKPRGGVRHIAASVITV